MSPVCLCLRLSLHELDTDKIEIETLVSIEVCQKKCVSPNKSVSLSQVHVPVELSLLLLKTGTHTEWGCNKEQLKTSKAH